jgi:hypothetical protein
MPKHTSCSPQLPCHDARHCSYCAALRQSHVADLAAARYRGGSLTYAVIDPRGYAGVTEARNLKPGSGGLWSVEIGAQVKGLHVNLLIEGQQSFTASDLATISRAQETDFWSKSVDPADLRNIAAYLVKLSGRPRKQEYDGRQMAHGHLEYRPLDRSKHAPTPNNSGSGRSGRIHRTATMPANHSTSTRSGF